MNKIIFVSSALQQPRHQKRIDLLKKHFNVEVLYYERNKYKENYKKYTEKAVSLGLVEDGKYFKRVPLLFNLYRKIKYSDAELVYCTSIDQVLIAFFSRKKIFFEVGDLYQVSGRNKVFKILDRFLMNSISCLILTSPYYLSGYYERFFPDIKNKTLVIENKLPPSYGKEVKDFREKTDHKIDGKIKIGLIGSLTFKKSLLKIRDFILNNDSCELHIFGSGLHDIFSGIDNCFYYGPFRNPEDLYDMYEKIDVNLIFYDMDNENVKLALPNKLYESIAFLKPIICSDGVALGEIVRRLGIGLSSSPNDLSVAVNDIVDNYDCYLTNMKGLPEESYLCFEQESIVHYIRKVIGW